MQYKNLQSFLNDVESKSDLKLEFTSQPVETLKRVSLNSEVPDTKIYRMVVASLIVAVLFVIVGLLIMVLMDRTQNNQTILTIFTAICSTAIGALAGVLVPSKATNEP